MPPIEAALKKYLSEWQLENPEQIGDTPRARVYKVRQGNEFFALKIFTDQGYKDEKHGAEVLKICDGDGMVRLVQDDKRALLMEYLEYPKDIHVEALVLSHQDEKACEIVADLLNRLHARDITSAAKNFPLLAERYGWLRRQAQETNMPLLKKADAIAKELLSQQRDVSILHGDLHHNNVMFSAARGYVMIDPKGVIGDRAYDIAYFLSSSTTPQDPQRISAQAEMLAAKTGIDRDRIIRYSFTQACLSACWCMEDKEDPQPRLAMAEIIEPLLGTK